MNPNPIEVENRFHAQMEHGYSVTLRDPSMSPSLRMAVEEQLNYHNECQEKNKRQKTSLGTVERLSVLTK